MVDLNERKGVGWDCGRESVKKCPEILGRWWLLLLEKNCQRTSGMMIMKKNLMRLLNNEGCYLEISRELED